jgi:DNA-binding transcriptional LysR family regulator
VRDCDGAFCKRQDTMLDQFDLIDITLFVNIAETSSLTRGARRSHISTPAASIRIKHLEGRLGAKLLDRSARGVALTPSGKAFLHHGRQFICQLEHLQADLRECSGETKGNVRLFINTPASDFLPPVLRNYLMGHPNVSVDLRECRTPDTVRAVANGMADIGVISSQFPTDGLDVLPYRLGVRLLILVALTHPLAKLDRISFEETLNFDYVGHVGTTTIQPFLNEAADSLGRSLKLRIQVNNLEELARMVETNIGIGAMPESAALHYRKTMAIHTVQLTDDWSRDDLKICVRDRTHLSPIAQELIDLLVADGKSGVCAPEGVSN